MKSLQNISYKTLFTILFLSLAGIVFFIRIGKPAQKVSAAWWDEMWHYRKAISIENSSGTDLTDFQVSISIGTSQLVADGKMQTDCDDIRITDVNGNLLPYWIEENNPGCNQNTDTKVWLKANSLPTSGATIYIYYGNQQASNNENGDNVFEFFDDFNDSNKTQSTWTATGTGFSITGGSLYHPTTLEPTNSFATYTINNSSGFTNGTIESRMKPASCGSSYGKGIIARYINDNNEYIAGLEAWTGNYTHVGKRVSGTWTNIDQDALTCDTNTWYQFKWDLNGTSQLLLVNGVASSGVDASFSSGKVGVHVDNRETPTGAYWDYIFVRKYASTQPAPTPQSEEFSPAPIAYWKFDEGASNTIQDSTGNFNGSFSGTTFPTWQSEDQCISGKCLYSTGNGSVLIGNPSNFRITNNSITIETWVKFNSLDYTNNTGKLIGFAGKGSPDTAPGIASSGFWFSYDNRNNGKSFNYTCFGNSAGGYAGGNNNFSGYNYIFNNNTWYHLAITISQNQGRLYINGQQIGSAKTFSGLQFDNTLNNLYISSLNGSYNLPGYIDEFKIYPYARTADQIKLDYNSRGSLSGSSVNLGVQSNTAPSLKSSLVAYWKFDENNGMSVYDSSGNNHTGTFIGTTTPTWQTGKHRTGVGFSGVNDSISLPYQPDFRNAFSVSIWFKRTTDYNQTTDIMLLSPPNAWYFYDSYNSGAIRGDVYIGGVRRAGINVPIPFDGNWYHVVYTYDSATHIAKMYKNGKLYQSVDLTSLGLGSYLIDSATGNLSNLGWNTNKRGIVVDEAKIYNRALTDEEVKQDYNAGSAIQFGSTSQSIGGTTTSLEYCIPGDTSFCASPVAEWNFEENTGTTAKDTSGNNNNGTISGASWALGANNKGSSLNFNGTSDYVSIPTFNYSTNATISVWVKGSYINGNQIIIGSPASISLGLYNIGSTKALIGYAGSSVPSKTVGIANNFTNDSWNHLSVVIDNSGNAAYYCNGQLLSNGETNNWSWTSGAYIGRRDTGTYFKGQIDQLKIYNYARTPAQIAYDYNRGAPVGWWKLDECQGSTAFDSSGLGNTGVISIGQSGTQTTLGTCQTGTSATWTNGATGKINSSLNFDGVDDYINISNSNNYNFTDALTVSSWIKLDSLNRYHGVVGKTASIWSDVTLSTRVGSDNKYSFVTYGTSQDDLSGGTADLNWHHVIFWFSKPTKRIYVDGVKVAENTWNQSLRTNNQNISLGAYAWGAGLNYLLNGKLDDVRIYNYALTQEQIKQVYNGGSVNFK